MQALAKKLDPTRAVTAAENVGDVFTGLPGTLEVRGWNYNITPERAVEVEAYRAKHPNQPNLGSEQGSQSWHARHLYKRPEARLRQCPAGQHRKMVALLCRPPLDERRVRLDGLRLPR